MSTEQYAVLPGKCKPSKSTSTDTSRPILQHAELRQTYKLTENGREPDGWELVVSDSYQLAHVRLEVKGDGDSLTPGPISPQALKAIEKTRGFRANGTIDPCDPKWGVPTGVSYPRPDVGQFPNWDQLTPEEPAPDDAYIVGLDAKLLHALFQSIDSDGNRNGHVFLRLDMAPFRKDGARSQLRPIAVSRNGVDFDGLLMPVRHHA